MTNQSSTDRPRHFAGLVSAVAVALGLAPGAAITAKPSIITPEAAPKAWLAYAAASTRTVTAWLNADDAKAARLRDAIGQTRSQPDQPTPPVVVKFWIDAGGLVRRVEIEPPPVGSSTDTAEQIRGLLVGRFLGAPPRRMRQPMRLALGLPAASPPPRSDI